MIIKKSLRIQGLLLTFGLAFSVAGVACKKDSTVLTVSAFCDEYGAKECGATGSGAVADNCLIDAKLCAANRAAYCMRWANTIQAEAPITRPFMPDNTDACLKKAASVYKQTLITPADTAALDAVCEAVFSGLKEANAVCASDFECDQSMQLICDPTFLVCAQNAPGSALCGGMPGATCNTGFYCAVPAAATYGTCTARQALGAACSASTPCLENLRCSPTTSTCAAKATITQPCTTDADCDATAPYCDPYVGNVCDTGFRPAPGSPECGAEFGTTPTGTGGAGGSVGAGGAGGNAGAGGTAGAGGVSGLGGLGGI